MKKQYALSLEEKKSLSGKLKDCCLNGELTDTPCQCDSCTPKTIDLSGQHATIVFKQQDLVVQENLDRFMSSSATVFGGGAVLDDVPAEAVGIGGDEDFEAGAGDDEEAFLGGGAVWGHAGADAWPKSSRVDSTC